MLRARLLAFGLLCAGPLPAADPLAGLRPAHPRLLLTDEQLRVVKERTPDDPLRSAVSAAILRTAEAQLTDTPIRHVLIGPRLLDQSRLAISQILTAAMAYRLTGDTRYFAFARAEMLRAADFPDWNPQHFLDVAEMSFAVGIGYDWLYPQLTAADRLKLRTALVEKSLCFAGPAYDRTDPQRESFPFVGNNLTNNWNQVCNGGFLIAALAIAEDRPDLARRVIAGLRATLPQALRAYDPDGAYPEGPTYWGYGTRYTVYILAALQTALGTDYGLAGQPGFDRTAQYRIQMRSPAGLSFNYADGGSGERLPADETITWLGQHFRQPGVVAASRRALSSWLTEAANPETARFSALHLAWFPEAAASSPPPPLDARFRGPAQTAVFRSAWGDDGALWLGFKAGSNTVNHAHLDLGSFALESDGVRWALDLGRDDYNLPGYWDRDSPSGARWRYYRLNNFGHNTLIPDAQLQDPNADAPIVRFESTPRRAFAVADLTAAYPGIARRVRRGVVLVDRQRVVVQDEAEGLHPGVALTWRMHTAATVSRGGDPSTAWLAQDGHRLRVRILAPANARFAVHSPGPLAAAENQNPGVTVLDVIVPAQAATADARVSVLLTPFGERWRPEAVPPVTALDRW